MPREDSAIIKLANAISKLGEEGLPMHVTPYVRDFVNGVASKKAGPLLPLIQKLLSPSVAPHILKRLPDQSIARSFSALLSNTASPTLLRAGAKINVIPGIAEMDIDGRTLPGQTEDDFLRELSTVLGPGISLEVLKSMPPTTTDPVESPLYDTIRSAILEREPNATVVPYMIPGYTDAKYFTKLGAKWYGFSPVKMPKDIRFAELFHGRDERVPVDGLAWGTDVLFDVVTRFCQ